MTCPMTEAAQVAREPELVDFCRELTEYVVTGHRPPGLKPALAALVVTAHRLEVLPERIIRAMHAVHCLPVSETSRDGLRAEQSTRYTSTIDDLLQQYFAHANRHERDK